MYVFCDNCKNHYDDAFQSEECDGPGVLISESGKKAHRDVATKPVADANAATRYLRSRWVLREA